MVLVATGDGGGSAGVCQLIVAPGRNALTTQVLKKRPLVRLACWQSIDTQEETRVKNIVLMF
ncbi:hypothetical protein E2C01_067538 [Portunus trituberculatus]|uniref:Uncharacterized protein n=1 Tax=Portunus trituberculatus TaxID=210409 RepID=A0A5B7HU09_PORTR|nr:hypothetical protein [Portunus trituberculatus]